MEWGSYVCELLCSVSLKYPIDPAVLGLGRREEALAAIQEAVTIYRGAGGGPAGRVPVRPGHVVANLPIGWADLGRREEALAAIQEAVTIRRERRGPAGRVPPRPGRR